MPSPIWVSKQRFSGRTYSGVWAAGQVGAKRGFTADAGAVMGQNPLAFRHGRNAF